MLVQADVVEILCPVTPSHTRQPYTSSAAGVHFRLGPATGTRSEDYACLFTPFSCTVVSVGEHLIHLLILHSKGALFIHGRYSADSIKGIMAEKAGIISTRVPVAGQFLAD